MFPFIRRRASALALLVASSLPGLGGSARAADAILVQDAHISSSKANKNYGGKSSLVLSTTDTVLLQFDLATLPSGLTGSSIQKANLWLWVDDVKAAGSFGVRRITQPWFEETVSSMLAPQTIQGADPSGIEVEPMDGAGYLVLDITALTQGWVAKSVVNHGIALVANPGVSLRFDSKENQKSGKAPRLEILLAATGPAGPAGPAGPKGDKGATGSQGPLGAQGLTGSPGSVGPQGPVGQKGDKGATGAVGPQGPSGVVGFMNATTNQETPYVGLTTQKFTSKFMTVTIAAGEKVLVVGAQSYETNWFGSSGAPDSLTSWIGYRVKGTTTIFKAGDGVSTTIPSGFNHMSHVSLSQVLSGLPNGTYEIGIVTKAMYYEYKHEAQDSNLTALVFK